MKYAIVSIAVSTVMASGILALAITRVDGPVAIALFFTAVIGGGVSFVSGAYQAICGKKD